MAKFRKIAVVIEATQWFKNGDHPEDYTAERPFMENGGFIMKPGSFFREHDWEGGIVRYFRRPDVDGEKICGTWTRVNGVKTACAAKMHDHGWIDTSEGGHIVCPGDWIITGVAGEHYPCKAAIFAVTYESAPEKHPHETVMAG